MAKSRAPSFNVGINDLEDWPQVPIKLKFRHKRRIKQSNLRSLKDKRKEMYVSAARRSVGKEFVPQWDNDIKYKSKRDPGYKQNFVFESFGEDSSEKDMNRMIYEKRFKTCLSLSALNIGSMGMNTKNVFWYRWKDVDFKLYQPDYFAVDKFECIHKLSIAYNFSRTEMWNYMLKYFIVHYMSIRGINYESDKIEEHLRSVIRSKGQHRIGDADINKEHLLNMIIIRFYKYCASYIQTAENNDMTKALLVWRNLKYAKAQIFENFWNLWPMLHGIKNVASILTWMSSIKEWFTDTLKNMLGSWGFTLTLDSFMSKTMMGIGIGIIMSMVQRTLGSFTDIVIHVFKLIFETFVGGVIKGFSYSRGTLQSMGIAETATMIMSMIFMCCCGSGMNMAQCATVSRFTGSVTSSLLDNVKPLMNMIFKQTLGLDWFADENELPGMCEFITEVLEFTNRPNINSTIITSINDAESAIALWNRYIHYRKMMIDVKLFGNKLKSDLLNTCKPLEQMYLNALNNSKWIHKRKTPIFIYLSGEAGQGKTTVIPAILSAVHARIKSSESIKEKSNSFNNRFTASQVYARTPGSDYWEGYANQWAVTYNEIFAEDAKDAKVVAATELLRAAESSTYPLNMAEVTTKGKTFFTSEILIATSNSTDFSNIGLQNPDAFVRRIHFPLTVCRKQNVSSKYHLDDAWNFFCKGYGERYKKAHDLGVSSFLPMSPKEYTFSQVVDAIVNEIEHRDSGLPLDGGFEDIDWNRALGDRFYFNEWVNALSEDLPTYPIAYINADLNYICKIIGNCAAVASILTDDNDIIKIQDFKLTQIMLEKKFRNNIKEVMVFFKNYKMNYYDKNIDKIKKIKKLKGEMVDIYNDREMVGVKILNVEEKGFEFLKVSDWLLLASRRFIQDERNSKEFKDLVDKKYEKLKAKNEDCVLEFEQWKMYRYKAIDSHAEVDQNTLKKLSDNMPLEFRRLRLLHLDAQRKNKEEWDEDRAFDECTEWWTKWLQLRKERNIKLLQQHLDKVKEKPAEAQMFSVFTKTKSALYKRAKPFFIDQWEEKYNDDTRFIASYRCFRDIGFKYGNQWVGFIWQTINPLFDVYERFYANKPFNTFLGYLCRYLDFSPLMEKDVNEFYNRYSLSRPNHQHLQKISEPGKFTYFTGDLVYAINLIFEKVALIYFNSFHSFEIRNEHTFAKDKLIKRKVYVMKYYNPEFIRYNSSDKKLDFNNLDAYHFRIPEIVFQDTFSNVDPALWGTPTYGPSDELAYTSVSDLPIPLWLYGVGEKEEKGNVVERVWDAIMEQGDKLDKNYGRVFMGLFLGLGAASLTAAIATCVSTLWDRRPEDIAESNMVDDGIKPLEKDSFIDIRSKAQSFYNKSVQGPRRFKYVPMYAESQVHETSYQRFVNMLSNSRPIRFSDGKGLTVDTNIFFITPHQGVVPAHAFFAVDVEKIAVGDIHAQNYQQISKGEFEYRKLDADRDGVIIHFKMPYANVKNVTKQVTSNIMSYSNCPLRLMKLRKSDGGQLCMVFSQGNKMIYKDTSIKSSAHVYGKEIVTSMKGYYLVEQGRGMNGFCAFPWISLDADHQNNCIFGIHVARLGEDSIVCPLFQSDFNDVTDTVQAESQMFSSDLFCSEVPVGTTNYYACKVTSNLNQKSDYEKTKIAEFLPKCGVAPAILEPWIEGDEQVSPWKLPLSKYEKFPSVAMPEVFSKGIRDPYMLFDGLFPNGYVYKSLTFEEAVFGTKEVESMEVNTSSGFPYVQNRDRTKKSDWINLEEKTFDPELKVKVHDLYSKWERRIYTNQVVVDNLKCELRDLEKIKKPRLFTAGSMVEMIVIKMVLGDFLAYVKRHIHQGSCSIGINAHSYDWTLLGDKLFKYGRERVIGGDISGLDVSTQRYSAYLMFCCFKYYFGFDGVDSLLGNLVMGCCYNVSTTVHVCGSMAYFCEHRNSSGNFITGIFNTITTWCDMWGAFEHLKPLDCEYRFQEALSGGFYGDDNLGSVHPEVHFFNNQTIQKTFKELYNKEYTDPKKGTLMDKFLSVPDQIFLSRQFVRRRGVYDAPLEEDCIMGMLHYVRTGEFSLEHQTMINVDTAKRELAHYEPIRAKIIEGLINSAVSKVGYTNTSLSVSEWQVRRMNVFSDAYSVRV